MHQNRRSSTPFLSLQRRDSFKNLSRNVKSLWFGIGVMAFMAVASRVMADDDMAIFSGVTQLNCNNGWQDWGWVPHYLTNNPAWNGNYTMAFAASGGWQAWYLEHDPIDTTIYNGISLWLNGGINGGQTVGLQAQAGSSWGPQIQVTAPTNSWQQFTFSLSALGVNNITNLQAIQIWNNSVAQPKFYIADVRLVAAPAPAPVHVNVGVTQIHHTVNPDMLGVNQVAWDGAIDTPTTVSLLNDMSAACLRWPGGSWGDGYHWTNEAWSAGATSPRNWGSFSPNFIQVATNTGAQAFIIVNYGTSDASEAAYGVRMFNITNHCHFKYWEIGNEVGGSWEWDWQYPGFATNDILDLSSLANKLKTPTNNISTYLRSQLSSYTLATLDNYLGNPSAYDAALRWTLVNDFNNLMYNSSQSIYKTDTNRFAGVTFRPLTWTNLSLPIPALGQDLANRMTLEDAYPVELAKLTPAENLASNWPNDDLPHDPWTYAIRFTNYYARMKAADPTIQIGAVADVTEDGTVNYTNHPVINPRTGVTHYGWTPVMLTYMRSNDCIPDFLIEHIYGPADGDTQDLLWYSKIKSDAASLRQMLTDYLGSAGSNVTLECTECGLGGDRQSCSLVGGLTYLDSLGEFLQTEFQSHIWWDFRNGQSALSSSDPSYYGWRTNSGGQYLADGGIVDGLGDVPSTRYPTYYCAELAAKFIRGGDQVVAATSDYALLATYAVRQTNGALNLLVINKSSYTNLTVTFNLANLYVPSPDGTTWSYGIPQDDAARTGMGSPDIAQGSLSGAAASFSDTFAPYSATVINLVPAAPMLTALPGSPPGQFVCRLQGLSDVPYVIEMTTDLAAGNWVPISTNTLTAGPRGTTPLNVTNNTLSSSAFYRAVWQP
jgi:hypothetical protein